MSACRSDADIRAPLTISQYLQLLSKLYSTKVTVRICIAAVGRLSRPATVFDALTMVLRAPSRGSASTICTRRDDCMLGYPRARDRQSLLDHK